MNASLKSYIDWCVHFKEPKRERLLKEVMIESNMDKDLFIKYFKECTHFEIFEDCIHFTVYQSDKEIEDDYKERIYQKEKFNSILKKKCKLKEEYKIQVVNYLKRNNLNWLLDELDFK